MSQDENFREVRPSMVAAMRGLEDLSRVLVAVEPPRDAACALPSPTILEAPPTSALVASGLSVASICGDPVGWVADGAGMTGSAVCDE